MVALWHRLIHVAGQGDPEKLADVADKALTIKDASVNMTKIEDEVLPRCILSIASMQCVHGCYDWNFWTTL